ncbi:MAG: hypothetical protein WC358_10800 [Ignavibacteria bacterium]|jgi:hypothetical protein
MPEKIVISFDDEKPGKPEDKIIIDLKYTPKKKPDVKIQNSIVDSNYKGNPYLTGFESSNLKYPEGLENGFRKIFSIKLNDTFLNSILLNNKFTILTSTAGKIFFIDRFKGNIHSQISLVNEPFEKTGVVIDNNIYVNSVKSVYGFKDISDGIKEKKLYESKDDFFIWSNLNKVNKNIVFLEYSPLRKTSYLVNLPISAEDVDPTGITRYNEFSISHFLYDSVIVYNDFVFAFYDDKILKHNFANSSAKEYNLKFNINADTNFLMLDGKIYFNNQNNELFYFDIANEEIRFTGIKCPYINSLAGFNDNIFIGTLNGWYLYKTTGVSLFSYEDINGNKIETLNTNILAVSNENKIIFHNLNKFQEAEGFTLTQGSMDSDSNKIISAKIGEDMIFVLSKSGILEAFNNDKLNLLLD